LWFFEGVVKRRSIDPLEGGASKASAEQARKQASAEQRHVAWRAAPGVCGGGWRSAAAAAAPAAVLGESPHPPSEHRAHVPAA
jgi:hypothetical protein